MNYKHFSEIYTDETAFLREKLQFLFDKSFEEQDESRLRNQYKLLRRLDFNCNPEFSPEAVNISLLCDSITSAFDIFASDNGKSFIYCGNSTCSVYGNHRLVTKAILNLLSNAYLYGNNSLVTTKTIEAGNYIKIEIINGGELGALSHDKNGLSYVRRICRLLEGHFFIESKQDSVKAIMMLQKCDKFTSPYPEGYTFAELLSDRLSPLYVEIFGMEYH